MKINKRSIQRAREEAIAEQVLHSAILISALVLNGVFGFGEKRMKRYIHEFAKMYTDYRNRYGEVAFDAIVKHAKEKGIEVVWK